MEKIPVFVPTMVLAGPPGAGKTLIARAMPGVLPEMSIEEALDVTRSYSVADQLPEFGSRVLEVMRQPMEDKQVTISRAQGSLTFPVNFQLIAAMNPCP
jgi:magnesium chelatase family protein